MTVTATIKASVSGSSRMANEKIEIHSKSTAMHTSGWIDM
jgi:hypothetical protein